jgi:hypothetical protein
MLEYKTNENPVTRHMWELVKGDVVRFGGETFVFNRINIGGKSISATRTSDEAGFRLRSINKEFVVVGSYAIPAEKTIPARAIARGELFYILKGVNETPELWRMDADRGRTIEAINPHTGKKVRLSGFRAYALDQLPK